MMRYRLRKNIFFLFLLVVFYPPLSRAANLDTSFKFSTIETKHFSIHFHQGLEDVAQKAASIAENAHTILTAEFKWEPREKTQIILIDDTDFTNGWANVLLYNTIYIQVVPPSIDTTIGEYEDWLKILITHEYSHILTMDPARGYSEVTRSIFGKPIPGGDPFSFLVFLATAPPNVFLPRWWHEGMATWSETEHTGMGRGRSTFYEMMLRAAVAENNIPDVDKLNGEVPYWPDGHMPYIFGLRLQKYIADKYGKEALGKLNLKHAGRLPYLLNGAPQDLFQDKDYIALYNEMVEDLKKEEKTQIEILKQPLFTQFKTLNIDGELLTNPRYSPDGNMLAFNRRDPHGHEVIIITDKDGAEIKDTIRRRYSDHSISWSPDSGYLYFSQAEINGGFNIYQDLYSYNIKDKKLKRLTHELRIKEPDVSPDGKRFAVVVSDRGSQNLALLDFEGSNYKLEKTTDYKLMRVSNPRWSPDGNFIVYSVTNNDGASGLYLYNVKDKTHRQIFEETGSNGYPTWSRDGRYIVYTSDKTNVYNLFAYSIEAGKRQQVAHILGGAFQPDISSDGKTIVFSSYDSRGFKIATMEYNPEKWLSKPTPTIKPYWNETADKKQISEAKTQAEGPLPAKSYSALDTLPPRFWLPTLSGDKDGPVLGAFTAGQDVLGYNTYYLEAGYGADSSRIYYDAAYLNDYTYPTFMIRGYERPVLYSDFLQKGDYYELNKGLILSMSVPINYLESRYSFIIGYHLQKQDALSDLSNNKFNDIAVFQGKRNNVFAGIEFNSSLKYPYSISREEGRRINLLYKHYDDKVGSDLNSREYLTSYSQYSLMPFSGPLRHHVVYLNLKGGVSEGDRINQQAFQLGGDQDQSEFPLRGYPSRFATGQYIATGTIEYRFPIVYILHGINTKPFFWDRVHAAFFADAGEVWGDGRGPAYNRLKIGAGMEARLDMTIGYYLEITPAIGVARA